LCSRRYCAANTFASHNPVNTSRFNTSSPRKVHVQCELHGRERSTHRCRCTLPDRVRTRCGR
jgi:hypothetical protein